MNYRPALVILALLTLIIAGCSKHSPRAGMGQIKVKDLGVVEVADGVEIRQDLGGGRVCRIMPALRRNGDILLAMTIEQTDAAGAVQVLSRPRVITRPDRAVKVSVGDVGVGLTPHVKP